MLLPPNNETVALGKYKFSQNGFNSIPKKNYKVFKVVTIDTVYYFERNKNQLDEYG